MMGKLSIGRLSLPADRMECSMSENKKKVPHSITEGNRKRIRGQMKLLERRKNQMKLHCIGEGALVTLQMGIC